MMADQANILDTLAREELGGSAYEAAFTSFFLFAFGALFPMLPYFFLSGTTAIILSLIVSAIGLFIMGGAITLMTGRSIWFSGTRQVLVGIGWWDHVMQGVLANWVLFAVAGGWIALWLTMRLGWWLHYQDEMGERLERQYNED